MALETGTHINSLNAANPTSVDPLAQADDHLRLLKATIKASFPNITGAMTATHTELNVLDGITATTAELNILDGVTSTAAELNILDGVTSTAAELNILDGVTATAAELNILDGVTATATELNVLDGITATTAELNFMDGVTSNVQTQLDDKSSYPAVIRVLTSGNYSIPSGSKAILIRASGGGGGGAGRGSGGHIYPGGHGGDTTVTNSTLGVSITAKGGQRGNDHENNVASAPRTGSSGGDVLTKAGAAGGSSAHQGDNVGDVVSGYDGHPGSLVTKYVIGSNVGGQTLSISYGAGGTGYSGTTADGAAGNAGYVEVWVW